MSIRNKLWTEKYRPQTLDKYAFQNEVHRDFINLVVESQSIPNLLLYGVPGTGKSTLARILTEMCNIDESDVLIINASDKRGIDTFRDDIKSFSETMPMGDYKVIILEEAERITGDAQKALKAFMEEVTDYCRFILTTNHVNQINTAIRSRCQEIAFKASHKDDIAEYLVTILAAEKVKFSLDVLYEYIDAWAPDIRKTLNSLQQHVIRGALQPFTGNAAALDVEEKLLECLSKNDWSSARTLVCTSVPSDQLETVFRLLYDNLHKVPKFKKQETWEEGIVLIAEHAVKHKNIDDTEINCAALFIRLSMIK